MTRGLSLLVDNYGGPGKAVAHVKWVAIWEMLATALGLLIRYLLSITSVAQLGNIP